MQHETPAATEFDDLTMRQQIAVRRDRLRPVMGEHRAQFFALLDARCDPGHRHRYVRTHLPTGATHEDEIRPHQFIAGGGDWEVRWSGLLDGQHACPSLADAVPVLSDWNRQMPGHWHYSLKS